jgi:acyl-coenzyme A thioesterase PaaI-like protein/rubrerythrin
MDSEQLQSYDEEVFGISRPLYSYEIFEKYQHASGELSQIPWGEFQPDLVRPVDISFAKGAVMGESNSIGAQHMFFNEFGDDYDFSAFVCLWGYQHLQDHLAFKKWLRLVGEDVEYKKINAMRAPHPVGNSPSATIATNIISEVAANHMYKCVAEEAQEPVIKAIMRRASGDDARHAREFAHYGSRRLADFPHEAASVLETLYIYLADPHGNFSHPVSRFKGDLTEVQGGETIDTVFERFADVDDGTEWNRARHQLFEIFSRLVGRPMAKLSDVRRAIAEVSVRRSPAAVSAPSNLAAQNKPIRFPWVTEPRFRCFGCSPYNPIGLAIKVQWEPDHRLGCDISFREEHSSYPGVVHGGIVGLLLDELMGDLIILKCGLLAFTVTLQTKFLRPVLVGTDYKALAAVAGGSQGLIKTEAEIISGDGDIHAMATATYTPIRSEQALDSMGLNEPEYVRLRHYFDHSGTTIGDSE